MDRMEQGDAYKYVLLGDVVVCSVFLVAVV
jgi:hypothetical protein